MDPKAAAKSKRKQSQQGKRNHPTPSAASAQKKKESSLPQSKQPPQSGEQKRSSRRHRDLPSNWDRYDDDDTAVEAEEGGQTPQTAAKAKAPLAGGGDAVVPKSKGADFGYLIEQARSHPRNHGYGDDGLVSAALSDEIAPDFVQGRISLVSVKGESLLSWCSNDNFTVDNDAGSSFEVPFLSIDINALAAQLSKLSMAQRLFIEEDILPIELRADKLNEKSIQRSDGLETQNSSGSEVDTFSGSEKEWVADGQSKPTQPKAIERHDYLQKLGKGVSPLFTQGQGIKQDPASTLQPLDHESKIRSGESHSSAHRNTIPVLPSRFEAATAEAELDRLLDAFDVTNDVASSSLSSSAFATAHAFGDHFVEMGTVSSRVESSSLTKVVAGDPLEDTVDEILSSLQLEPLDVSRNMDAGPSRPGFGKSSTIVPVEKSIDDLLAETSFIGSSGLDGQSDGALAQYMYASNLRGGHGSRHTTPAVSLDETIDDLLAESSSDHPKSKDHTPHRQGKYHMSCDESTAVSKALDDIDSWLDSI